MEDTPKMEITSKFSHKTSKAQDHGKTHSTKTSQFPKEPWEDRTTNRRTRDHRRWFNSSLHRMSTWGLLKKHIRRELTLMMIWSIMVNSYKCRENCRLRTRSLRLYPLICQRRRVGVGLACRKTGKIRYWLGIGYMSSSMACRISRVCQAKI